MDWEETLYRWEEYSEKLYPLRDEVAHIFETKCFYDDNWKRGLCPKLMRKVPHYVLSDKSGWDSFWETYNEVAKCLHGESMSYSATKRAIEEFEASWEKLKLRARN